MALSGDGKRPAMMAPYRDGMRITDKGGDTMLEGVLVVEQTISPAPSSCRRTMNATPSTCTPGTGSSKLKMVLESCDDRTVDCFV